MHAIRSQARRRAWYNNDPDDRTYNLFGRINTDRHLLQRRNAWLISPDALDPTRPDTRRPHSVHQHADALKHGERLVTESDQLESADAESVNHDPRIERLLNSVSSQLRLVLLSWANIVFLPLVPAGFAVYYTHQSPTTVFVVNFLAVLPTALLLGFGTDEATLYLGPRVGGLLSMSLSNVAQLITSIFLLKDRQIKILEASLLGSILQNLLLMTGAAFVAGGIQYQEQYFGQQMAQTVCMLLLLAVLSLLVPTLAQLLGNSPDDEILRMSRGTAIIIMVSYVLYLVFSTITDPALFKLIKPMPGKLRGSTEHIAGPKKAAAIVGAVGAASSGGAVNNETLLAKDPPEEIATPAPILLLPTALITVIVSTTLLTFNTSFATDSLQGLLAESAISDTFMGLVVLPLLGNDFNGIRMALQDRVDMSIALSLEKCMQTSLMVVPLIVLIAWGMGVNEVSMEFDKFLVAALFCAIIIVSYVVQEGRCNWLYGALLVKIFVIVALAAFYTT